MVRTILLLIFLLSSFPVNSQEFYPPAPTSGSVSGDTTPFFPPAPTGGRIDPPEVALTLTNLVAGQFEDGTIEWTATCTNAKNAITSVQLYADGVAVGDADITAPYTEAWITGHSTDAIKVLKARCTAADGQISDSPEQVVTIDVTAPTIHNLSAVAINAAELLFSYGIYEMGSGVNPTSVNILRCNPSPCTPAIWQQNATNPYTITGLGASTIYDWQVSLSDKVGNAATIPTKVTAGLPNLVALYELQSDGTDSSLTANNATVNGNPTFVAGKFGNAVNLDGTGDYLSAANHANYDSPNAISVVAWTNCNGTCGATSRIVAQDGASSTTRRWELRTSGVNTGAVFTIYSGDTAFSANLPSGGLATTGWNMVSGRYDRNNIRLGIDGVQVAQIAATGAIDQDTVNLTIGGRANGSGLYTGLIDRVRVYNTFLSAADLQALYAQGITETQGLYSKAVEAPSIETYDAKGYSWGNNALGVSSVTPAGFVDTTRASQTFAAWGREYVFSNSLMPTQITSQATNLFQSAPTFTATVYGTQIGTGTATLEPLLDSPTKRIWRTTIQDPYAAISIEWELDYSGFLIGRARIIPKSKHVRLDDVQLKFPFVKAVAACTARYLPYDFETQIINKQALRDSSECIGASAITYPFNPSAFFGNGTVGAEVIMQTNADIYVADTNTVNTISPEASSNDLIINLIDGPIRISNDLMYAFAILPVPIRPMRSDWRTWHMVASSGPISNTIGVRNAIGSNWRVILPTIYNHAEMPLQYASFPVPAAGTESTFQSHVNTLHASGVWVTPYNGLYAMDTRVPELGDWRSLWESAALRTGSWGNQLGFNPSTQPVAYDHKSIQDFVLHTHKDVITRHGINGTYWDLANFSEIDLVKTRYFPTAGVGTQFYPIFSAREFLKRYWTMSKSLDPDFLITHHGNRVSYWTCTWVDICASGEVFNNFFRLPGATTTGFPPVWNDPTLYDPDYSDTVLIPRIIWPDEYSQKSWGFANMMMPQIRKFNDAYLNANPSVEEAYSRTMLGMILTNDMLNFKSRYLATFRNGIANSINVFGKLENVARLNRISTGTGGVVWASGFKNAADTKAIVFYFNDSDASDSFTFDIASFPGLSGYGLSTAVSVNPLNAAQTALTPTGTTVPLSISARDLGIAVFTVTPP